MPADTRVSDLLGVRVVDSAGRRVGRIVDLHADETDDGPRITAAVVVRGPWGRLLGYERAQAGGPWLLETAARAILRRDMTTVPWSRLRFDRPDRATVV
ncbi:PRC-barrel domain-containing protein [Asanoa sp. NPDC050611]|uniref:PRC-barrel domain-containing protein n=1 Tax=Asanoa sp. NPDC050611 TaxID=3157098 RepID=UPI0033E55361